MRKKFGHRLGCEELESRSLTAVIVPITGSLGAAPSSTEGQGVLVAGGLPSDTVPVQIGSPVAGMGLAGFNGFGGFGLYASLVLDNNATAPSAPIAPSALDGVGQMTIADGANTLGFAATATDGFYSRAGGSGNLIESAPAPPSEEEDVPQERTGAAEQNDFGSRATEPDRVETELGD
jgi:hypothetical protein